MRSNGKFKMVQFADLHWETGAKKSGCDDLTMLQKTFPCTDLNTSAFMARVLDAEAPVDLVIFTGDNIDGGAPDAVLALKQATQVVADRKIPWAMILGNHDSESSSHNRAELEGIAAGLPFSLSRVGPASLSTSRRTSGYNRISQKNCSGYFGETEPESMEIDDGNSVIPKLAMVR